MKLFAALSALLVLEASGSSETRNLIFTNDTVFGDPNSTELVPTLFTFGPSDNFTQSAEGTAANSSILPDVIMTVTSADNLTVIPLPVEDALLTGLGSPPELVDPVSEEIPITAEAETTETPMTVSEPISEAATTELPGVTSFPETLPPPKTDPGPEPDTMEPPITNETVTEETPIVIMTPPLPTNTSIPTGSDAPAPAPTISDAPVPFPTGSDAPVPFPTGTDAPVPFPTGTDAPVPAPVLAPAVPVWFEACEKEWILSKKTPPLKACLKRKNKKPKDGSKCTNKEPKACYFGFPDGTNVDCQGKPRPAFICVCKGSPPRAWKCDPAVWPTCAAIPGTTKPPSIE